MRLSDLFDHLTFGELAHVFIGGGDKREIAPTSYRELGLHLNMGLTALHTRFLLREEEVLVEKQGIQSEYLLDSLYAASNEESGEPVKYLLDSTASPFTDNIIRITEAYASDGTALPLNNADELLSLFTPRHNLLQIPYGEHGDTFAILYQADHPRLKLTAATDPTQVDVDLHPSFIQALLFFVAARAITPAGSDATGDSSNNLMMRYELECQRLNQFNLDADESRTSTTLEKNGWV
jgi:hypothetical protein